MASCDKKPRSGHRAKAHAVRIVRWFRDWHGGDGPIDALLKDTPPGFLERAFRDYKDTSRVFLPGVRAW